MQRFFIDYKEINNKFVTFDKDQSKKIRKVLRMKVEDKVVAFDNKGWEYDVILTKITNNYSLGKIIDRRLTEIMTHRTLLQALPKNLKIEFILQKTTELGIDRIILFESEFSQVKASGISEDKVKRWRKIVTEASEQCGRILIPTVELFTGNLEELLALVLDQEILDKSLDNVVYLDQEGNGLNQIAANLDLTKLHFFVGPEGGFSPKERVLFDRHNIKKVKIAENILRSETAGMAFLAQVQAFL